MMSDARRRLQTWWGIRNNRRRAPTDGPARLVIEKTAWLHGAVSPVMLSVDDLTNAWHGDSGSGRWLHGGDWGGGMRQPDSALRFLETRLLSDFREVKVTFFTVAGPISPYTIHQPFSHAAALDATAQSRAFFRQVADDPRFELAYHGLNHGTPGVRTDDFLQEWRGFPSVDAAIAQTQRGIDIFRSATGRAPRGGKYGGWEYNEFSESAVDRCGFAWWCRDWMPRDVSGRIPSAYYEPQYFGASQVVALPTTVHGRFWDRRQIDQLMASRQIIAVEEHIAGVRPDGRIQTPNVVDDIDDLRRLFAYLRGKPVWHATGSEIADYIVARDSTEIGDVDATGFSTRHTRGTPRSPLTLQLECRAALHGRSGSIVVELPDGTALAPEQPRPDSTATHVLITIPPVQGRFRIHVRHV